MTSLLWDSLHLIPTDESQFSANWARDIFRQGHLGTQDDALSGWARNQHLRILIIFDLSVSKVKLFFFFSLENFFKMIVAPF